MVNQFFSGSNDQVFNSVQHSGTSCSIEQNKDIEQYTHLRIGSFTSVHNCK